jgi:hypothetical protein
MVKRPKCEKCGYEAESWHSLPDGFMGEPYCPNCKESICDTHKFDRKLQREEKNGIYLGFGKSIQPKDVKGIAERKERMAKRTETRVINGKTTTIVYRA